MFKVCPKTLHKFFIQLKFNETCLFVYSKENGLLLRGSVFPRRISLEVFTILLSSTWFSYRGSHLLINLFVEHTRYINSNDGVNQLRAKKTREKLFIIFQQNRFFLSLLQIEKTNSEITRKIV